MFDEANAPLNPSKNDISKEVSIVDGDGEGRKVYTLYKSRYLELGLYCLGTMLNQMCWISLQPCAGALKNGYGVGNTEVAAIGFIYFVVFLIVNFPSNYVLDTYGLKIGVLVGIFLTMAGMWVKCLINHNFNYVFVGQTIAAIGQPFLSCAPGKLAALWFGENERVIATVVATVFQPIGVAVGYVLPSFWVTADDSLPENAALARHNIYQLLFWQAVIGTVIFVICAIGFREKPPTPPSSTEATETGNVLQNIKSVLKNKNAMIEGMVFGIILGLMNTYGTIMGIMADGYGYTEGQISLFGAIFIVGGIIGSGVIGGIVEVYKNYKKALIAIALMTSVSPIGLLFALLSMKVWLVAVACFIVGFASISVLPVGIDFGVELTHPIGEAISTGVQMSLSQILAIIFTILASVLISEKGDAGIIWSQCILIAMAIVAAVLSFFVTEDLRRLTEARHNQRETSSLKGISFEN